MKATKTSTNVKKKKTTKFPWSKKLNMENVDKITYTSSKKSVVTVNKNGKITAKEKRYCKGESSRYFKRWNQEDGYHESKSEIA